MRVLDLFNPFGAPVYFVEQTSSTMEEIRSLFPCPHGTVVCAGYQTRGRGRMKDRRWEANPGENLLFTVFLMPERISNPLSTIPLLLGLSVAETLEKYLDLEPSVKWPNDVLVKGSKVSGILCEGGRGWVLGGIGININQSVFPPGFKTRGGSLYSLTGKFHDPFDILSELLKVMGENINSSSWQVRLNKRLYRKGTTLDYLSGFPGSSVPREVRIIEVGKEGQLVVETQPEGRTLELFSGEFESAPPSRDFRFHLE